MSISEQKEEDLNILFKSNDNNVWTPASVKQRKEILKNKDKWTISPSNEASLKLNDITYFIKSILPNKENNNNNNNNINNINNNDIIDNIDKNNDNNVIINKKKTISNQLSSKPAKMGCIEDANIYRKSLMKLHGSSDKPHGLTYDEILESYFKDNRKEEIDLKELIKKMNTNHSQLDIKDILKTHKIYLSFQDGLAVRIFNYIIYHYIQFLDSYKAMNHIKTFVSESNGDPDSKAIILDYCDNIHHLIETASLGHEILNRKQEHRAQVFLENMVNSNLPSTNDLIPDWNQFGAAKVDSTSNDASILQTGFKKGIHCVWAKKQNDYICGHKANITCPAYTWQKAQKNKAKKRKNAQRYQNKKGKETKK